MRGPEESQAVVQDTDCSQFSLLQQHVQRSALKGIKQVGPDYSQVNEMLNQFRSLGQEKHHGSSEGDQSTTAHHT